MRGIGAIYGVSRGLVAKWFRRHGIRPRAANSGLLNRGIVPPTREVLERLVHAEHKTYQQVAGLYGVDQSAIRHWLIKHNLPMPTPNYTKHKVLERDLPDADTLRSLYATGMTGQDIADRYDVSASMIFARCKSFGIARRRSGFNSSGRCRYTTKDGTEVRSSYEMRVADWFHDHGIAYIYEPRVPFGSGFRGDFLANGWFVEVWGVKDNPVYRERRDRKREGYAAHGLPLIQLSSYHLGATGAASFERRLSRCLVPAGSLDPASYLPIQKPGLGELVRLYEVQGLTINEIAGLYRVSGPTARRWLIVSDIKRRPARRRISGTAARLP